MNNCSAIVIRSHANPTVRHLIRLRNNRTRRKEKRLLVDGWRETRQAIDAGLELVRLVVPEITGPELNQPELNQPESNQPELTAIAHSNTQLIESTAAAGKLTRVSDAVMQKIAYGDSWRGVVGEFLEPCRALDDLTLPEVPLILVLDCLEKPGNIGAVFRSADAAGVDAVICCGSNSSDVYNPNAIRSSLGTVFSIQSASATETQTIKFLMEKQIQIVTARVESSTGLWETDLRGPLAIILGSESNGLGNHFESIAGTPTAAVRIPMLGAVDSLNVSVSAAVILYEAQRQRSPMLRRERR